MPSMSCRDCGVPCDWFFKGKDNVEVIVAMMKHYEEEHNDIMKEYFGKKKIWKAIQGSLAIIKPDPPAGAAAA